MYPYHITHGYIRLRSLKKPMKYFTYLSPSVITVFDQTPFGIITKNKMLSESPGSLSAISANFKRVSVLYYHFFTKYVHSSTFQTVQKGYFLYHA